MDLTARHMPQACRMWFYEQRRLASLFRAQLCALKKHRQYHYSNPQPATSNTMDSAEYHDVIRVSATALAPTGYNFLPGAEDAVTAQYARDMTLAAGRILYEVWVWTFDFFVPSKTADITTCHRTFGLTPYKATISPSRSFPKPETTGAGLVIGHCSHEMNDTSTSRSGSW